VCIGSVPEVQHENLLGDFNAKVEGEDIFKVTIRVYVKLVMIMGVGVGILSHQTVKSTVFPHHNVHKHILNSPDLKTHNQTNNVLTEYDIQI
jgi:hypothetical protein